MKQPKNSLQLLNPTKNTRKIAYQLMTVASGAVNLQSKHDFICYVAKVKASPSAHSMADVILCSVFNIPFESNVSLKPKQNVCYTQ